MKSLLCSFGVVTVISVLLPAAIVRSQSKDRASMERAKELWEMAIAAKGGRQRLYAVKNIAITQQFSKSGVSTELCVFPDKHWFWEDHRPGKLGLASGMKNFERNVGYFVVGHLPNDAPKRELKPEEREPITECQLLYILESRWFKPELLGAYKDNLGSQPVDVVEIKVEKFRTGVFLDTKTHLPVRIGFFSNYKDKIFTWYVLSDYREVNSILVPHSISHDGSRSIPVQVEINVEYDPAVFERPPRIADGPFQWRAKGN